MCRENAHGPTLTKSLAARRRLAGCQEIGTPPHFVKKTNEGFSATPAAQRQRRTPLRTSVGTKCIRQWIIEIATVIEIHNPGGSFSAASKRIVATSF